MIGRAAKIQAEWTLELNNEAVPAVGELTASEFEHLLDIADFTHVIDDSDSARGFIIGLADTNAHDSFNFNWFCDRYEDFLYIDRIVVDPGARGTGIGRKLYEAAIEWCQSNGVNMLTCEVNDDPPNPVSHAFHRKLGFSKIESIEHPKGLTVCMYMMQVPPPDTCESNATDPRDDEQRHHV